MDESATAEGTAVSTETSTETEVTQPNAAEAQESQEETTQTESTEPSGEETTETKEETPKRNSFQERISELTGKVKTKEAELQEQIQRGDALEAALKEAQQGEAPKMPTLEECGYDESVFAQRMVEYHTAVNQNSLSEFRKSEQEHDRQRAQEELNRAIDERFRANQAQFATEHPDFLTVVSNPAFVQADHVANAIRMDDNGPALAYHLAQNPALTDTLNRMNPVSSLMELGRISAQLAAPPPVTTTQTPPPATPVKPTGTVQKDPDKMSPEEYRKWRDSGGG